MFQSTRTIEAVAYKSILPFQLNSYICFRKREAEWTEKKFKGKMRNNVATSHIGLILDTMSNLSSRYGSAGSSAHPSNSQSRHVSRNVSRAIPKASVISSVSNLAKITNIYQRITKYICISSPEHCHWNIPTQVPIFNSRLG